MAIAKKTMPVVLGGEQGMRLPEGLWPIHGARERERLLQVLESGKWAYDGPFEAEFERRFADAQTARHGLCVANGTVAIQLALEALDIGYGDEVIVPGLTWQATAAAVVDVNAVPVLVDILPDSYCIDPELVEAAVTSRTKAIIPVHLYSSMADMDRILEIARRHQLYVIEDCAHAHGSRWNGLGAGSLGDIGTFSFQSTKTLTAGEGGFVTANDDRLYERLYSLRNCGRPRPGADVSRWEPVQSGNYRTTEWQAAVLLAQLERFDQQAEAHALNAQHLDGKLRQLPGIRPMANPAQVTRRNLYQYAFRYDEAAWDGLPGSVFRKALAAEVGHVSGPYEPLNMSPLYKPLTKRRHHLNEEYCAAIDTARITLSVAERAHLSEGVVIAHQVLLERPESLDALAAAIERLYDHLPALLEWHRHGGSGQ